VGDVANMDRTNATGALNVFWHGYRVQSTGTQPIDAGYVMTGKANYGLMLCFADFGANLAAIALKATQRFYYNVTATDASNLSRYPSSNGGEYMAYSSSDGELQFFGQSAAQFAVGRVVSSVNYVKAAGAATGAIPGFEAAGSDANVSIRYVAKATGQHFFYSDGGGTAAVQFNIGRTASAVNYFTAKGSVTGSSVTLEPSGTDTNVGSIWATKGSGTHLFRTGGSGGTTQMSLASSGLLSVAGAVLAENATAIPAGGTAGAGFRFSSTSNFGVFFGSGAPSLAAAKGSIYLRSDGSTTNDRLYVNTDGSTTWTAVTTAG
jgi:hypothetical protein